MIADLSESDRYVAKCGFESHGGRMARGVEEAARYRGDLTCYRPFE